MHNKCTRNEIKCHTFICLCSAHIIKALANRVCHVETDRTRRKLVIIYFACLQHCMTLAEVIHTYEQICTVLCSEYHTPAVAEGYESIKKNVVGKYNVTLDLDELDTKADIGTLRSCMFAPQAFKKLRAASPFTEIFKRSIENLDLTSGTKTETPNSYLPKDGFKIIKDMTFLFPLWKVSLQVNVERFAIDSADSNAAITHQRCKTNGEVESHFRYVKRNLLQSRLRLRHSIYLKIFLVNLRRSVNDLKLPTLKVIGKRVLEVTAEEEKWKKRRVTNSAYTDKTESLRRLSNIQRALESNVDIESKELNSDDIDRVVATLNDFFLLYHCSKSRA